MDVSVSLEKLRQQVEEQLRAAEGRVRELRTKKNALAPLCRLPVDVLVHILFHLAYNNPHNHCFSGDCHHTDSTVQQQWIITATHVCRRLRDVAIAHPVLWTCLPLYSTPLTRTFLKRSKQAEGLCLHVPQSSLNKTKKMMRNLEHTMKNNSHRVGALRIAATSPDLDDFLNLKPSPAPCLEELNLKDITIGSECLELPDAIFTGCTPRLHTVRLQNVIFPDLLPAWLTGLRHLHVSYSGRMSTSQITYLLYSNQNLRSVTLEGAHMFKDGRTLPEPVALPYLEHMTLMGFLEPCAELFDRLDLPGKAIINWRVLLSTSEFAPSALPVITRLTSGQRSHTVDALSVYYSDGHGTSPIQLGCLHLLQHSPSHNRSRPFVNVFFELSAQSQGRSLHKYALLNGMIKLIRDLPLPDLGCVYVDGLQSKDLLDPENHLTLPRQTICVNGNPPFALVRAFFRPNPQTSRRLLPGAHTLLIENSNFVYTEISMFNKDHKIYANLLRDSVKEDPEIRTIKIVKCQEVTQRMISSLEEVVDTVLCDELNVHASRRNCSTGAPADLGPPPPDCTTQ